MRYINVAYVVVENVNVVRVEILRKFNTIGKKIWNQSWTDEI